MPSPANPPTGCPFHPRCLLTHQAAAAADDRRVLFQHAVLLSFADGDQSADEVTFLHALAGKLRIPDEDVKALMLAGSERAKKYLKLL